MQLPDFMARGRLALPDFCGLCTCSIPDSKWRSIIAAIRPLGIGVVPVDTVKRPGKRKENITP